MQELSREDVEDAFREIGEILVRDGKIAEIAGYRGAAILLRFEASFRTADVDASVDGGDHGALMAPAARVAERRGWLRSWLSEAVTVYLGGQGGTGLYASYPSEARAGLRVYVARPEYLLAMKLRAMRVGRRDEQDAVLLARACGIASLDGMLALLARYFPKDPPDPRRIAIVGQFVEALNASTSGHAG